ncbi:MAG: asparagine synthase (glutamine-hydrolyzing) [Bacillota bacterium]|nr:asparagine synthase (glutamine-hydrolyzing) [Bacillota bacterium]
MCAIGGIVDIEDPLELEPERIRTMLDTMARRGPDQEGLYKGENAILLHRRLSVIDIDHGAQPMTVSHQGETYTLVYNGELYNTGSIQRELEAEGFSFGGYSDTEVVLKACIAWGHRALAKFNGIFAFGLWRHKAKELFLARDPMGVKPLFYAEVSGKLVFASEIKTILASGLIEAEADMETIAEVILMGPGRTPGCGVFRGMRELPPGCWGCYKQGSLEIERYFYLEDRPHKDSLADTITKTRLLVIKAIERQLVADVPLGTFLSGGLDSSIISAVAASHFRERGEALETFSVFYRDNEKYFQPGKFQPNSDHEYIDIMVKHLGCKNHKLVVDTPELVAALYEAVEARDLPGMADVDSSLLLLCREIKKHCTVALSGECADEIFGGYPWFRDKTIREAAGFPWAQSTEWRASFLRPELAAVIDAPEYVAAKYEDTVGQVELMGAYSGNADDLSAKRMMYLNMVWFMQTLLDRKDRMSMYSGLEVRVPFCDKAIAQYLYNVPWAYKDYKGYEKGLLREAVKDLLPPEILWRKKSPYPKTHNPGYLKAVVQELNEVINDPNAPILDIVSKESLTTLTGTVLSTPWYGQLMTVPQTIAYFLQLNYWLKTYKVKLVV